MRTLLVQYSSTGVFTSPTIVTFTLELKLMHLSVFHQPSAVQRLLSELLENYKCENLTAGIPGQTGEGGQADDEVEDGPAHDDAVVDVEEGD